MNPWSRYIASLIHVPLDHSFSQQRVLTAGGRSFERIAYSSDAVTLTDPAEASRCPHCGVVESTPHAGHCPQEVCPACHGRLASCGCFPDRTLSVVPLLCIH